MLNRTNRFFSLPLLGLLKLITLIFVFIFLFTFSINAQGLNFELGFNNSYKQSSYPIINYEGYTYMSRYEPSTESTTKFFTWNYLTKIDSLGQINWEEKILFDSSLFIDVIDEPYIPNEYIRTLEMIVDTSGIYILTQAPQMCDVLSPTFYFIRKYNHSGEEIWSKYWLNIENNNFETNISGMQFDLNDFIRVHFKQNGTSKIYSLNAQTGSLVDSVNVDVNKAGTIIRTDSFPYIVSDGNVLKVIDGFGNTIISHSFSQIISNAVIYNDTLLLLSGDTLHKFSSDLTSHTLYSYSSYSNFNILKIINNNIYLMAVDSQNSYILSMSSPNSSPSVIAIPYKIIENEEFNYFKTKSVDFNISHITFTDQFNLAFGNSIRLLDYSLITSLNIERQGSDAAVVGIIPTNVAITYDYPTFIKIDARVCVKNFGNLTIDKLRLNHYNGPYIGCGEYFFTEEFINLNIQPGDSIWIDCFQLHDYYKTFSLPLGDSLVVNLCAYSSNPKGIVDLNVSNDMWCQQVFLGYMSINTIDNNLGHRKLLKIVDLMGRETSDIPNSLLFFIYDNGEVEKIYRFQ